jgi:hypothetical protein
MAESKAKAKRLADTVETAEAVIVTEAKEPETKKEEEEMVTIIIPQIPGEAKELTFGINGVFTKVKKGRLVKVPRPIAKLWENSQRQQQTAEETQEIHDIKNIANNRVDL